MQLKNNLFLTDISEWLIGVTVQLFQVQETFDNNSLHFDLRM